MYETKLISPDGVAYNIPYYEIGNYLEKIIREFINDNEDNKELFQLFQSEYSYFYPYLDFAITVLGYKIENPFVFEESVLYGENGNLINKRSNSITGKDVYDRITEKNYNIDDVDIDNLKDSVIMPNGLKFEVNRDEKRHHEQIYEIILLEKMIYDKNLYNDYLEAFTNPIYKKIYINMATYFRRRLGYGHLVTYDDKSGFILYEECLKNEFLDNLLLKISEKYPDIGSVKEDLSKDISVEEINKILKTKQEVGEIHESRRL